MPSIWTRIRNVWSKVSAIILLLTAAAGILYEIFHKIGFVKVTEQFIGPEEVLIILVSLLCGGLGAERLLVLGDIEESIKSADIQSTEILEKVKNIARELLDVEMVEKDIAKEVSSLISSLSKANLLVDRDEIEAAACRLINSCSDNDKIRATSQYFPQETVSGPLSENYYKTIADRLKRARPGSPLEYQVVLPASFKDQEVTQHRQIFETLGVSERVSTLYIRSSWPFELLIGGKSINIAFPGGTSRRPTYEMAISVTDEVFVKKANEWFLELISRETQGGNQPAGPASTSRAKRPNVT